MRGQAGNVHTRLCRLALLFPLWGMSGAVLSDEGIPALLQFAEQYHNPAPEVPSSVTGKPDQKSTVPTGDTPVQRRSVKQQNALLVKQKTALREQEKQLVALRQALATAEHQRQALPVPQPLPTPSDPIPPQKSTDFSPLQQLVGHLRDAAGGSPEAKRSAGLIAQARLQAEQRQAALTHSQEQVRGLTQQVEDLKKQLQNNVQGIGQAQQAWQTKLDGLQAQLQEKAKALQMSQQQLATSKDQHTALTQQLAARQKIQDDRQQQAEKSRTAARASHDKTVAVLQTQLGEREKACQTTLESATQKEVALARLQTEKQKLQKQYDTLQQQARATDTRLVKQEQEILRLQGDVQGLHERAKWQVKPASLDASTTRQAYAAGTALGRDIVTMLDERKGWGVQADRQTVLAGVIDAFSGQYQLSANALTTALADSEASVNLARKKARQTQQQKDDAFVADFRIQKGVKQSPSGFWYRVDYAGDAPMAKDAVIDVVVKELLTDGTVVQDMDLNGKVLSQPRDAYPPLFREAIGYLRNHGTLTLVVPPTLAYGEAGYPPTVPPNATLMYTLRAETGTADTNDTRAGKSPAPKG
ncbi:FKBP-type peptidyl-prolyl cis-trans isomerase fkpA precursor [Serratia proteamaculans]|uniref:FKBP-type peptidyl-prolyl cis-trans isomerase N-terminal domain-containing protein n=1 Tax=Serratia proteamaculans TaxID=28151 RepID=UPI002178D48E|nr:FKBP-type peptidyl-prolyl cis-trans isomerase N-terminal domain-containing protein [Serratia proteamaculans]CAI2021284.1 FKBP-type peptidyl-prolyl cis-trans isomerase fkpA precursor [Serratia proteamaculans]